MASRAALERRGFGIGRILAGGAGELGALRPARPALALALEHRGNLLADDARLLDELDSAHGGRLEEPCRAELETDRLEPLLLDVEELLAHRILDERRNEPLVVLVDGEAEVLLVLFGREV